MDVIARPRQKGKTTELVRRAAENHLYIVSATYDEGHRLFREAFDQGINIPHPITWDDFVQGRYYGRGIRGFLIDNLDLCVQSMTAVPISAVTLTLPDGYTITRPVTAAEEAQNRW